MHFILRRISGQGAEMTKVLGKSYSLITKEKSPEHFREDFKLLFDKHYIEGSDDERVFALISGVDGENPIHIQALYSNQENYIMTSDGKTFSKITPNIEPQKI